MTTAEQTQFRRGTASQMAAFTGAAGEIAVDTTNNRAVVQDGATAGGFSAAKLAEVRSYSAGFVSKFRNSGTIVDQRGTAASIATVTTSGSYVTDGDIVIPTGASVTAQQAASQSGFLSSKALKIVGATSVSDVIVRRRIESLDTAPLAGSLVTVQCKVYNGTGGSITPVLSVGHPTSADTYSSVGAASLTNEVNAQNLQACPASATTTLTYTFSASANVVNGLEVNIDLGNNFGSNSKIAYIGDWDIRVTPGLSTGLNSLPLLLPELRLIGVEMPINQRFFQIIDTVWGIGTSTTTVQFAWQGTIPMFAGPTIGGFATAAITDIYVNLYESSSPGVSWVNTPGLLGGRFNLGGFSPNITTGRTYVNLSAGYPGFSTTGTLRAEL